MPFQKTKIRTVSEPTIPLTSMETDEVLFDIRYADQTKSSKYKGTKFPYITFMGREFTITEILSFEIDCSNFLPIMHLEVFIQDRAFIAHRLPKDGDIISVYMRSHNDVYKPLRNDYLITHIETTSMEDNGVGNIFYVTGVLNLKQIWVEKNKAFKGTSMDVIMKVADELQLGFATNIDGNMSDEMTWICDWKSYKDFLLHIAQHSWKDEKRFYRIFIDVYYYVNFIEVEKQLDQTKEFDEALLVYEKTEFLDSSPIAPLDELPNEKTIVYLTNFSMYDDNNAYITNYELLNNSSQISYSEGYGKKMYYYDYFLKEISETNKINFNPLFTPGTESTKIRLRGLKDEQIEKEHLKNIWNGVQYSLPIGNVHQNFSKANYQNYVNNKELEKLQLIIDMKFWNPSIIKMERIPIILFEMGDLETTSSFMSQNELDDFKNNQENVMIGNAYTINRFLSGFYIVEGIKIKYKAGMGYNTASLTLTRREWVVPQDEEFF
jgi:hypothetical protein